MATSGLRLPMEITQLKYTELCINNDQLVRGRVGAFGEVKIASLDSLPSAAKHFFCHNTTAEERVKIEQDLQITTILKHPNLVQCYGTSWCVQSGKPILLMELLEESLPQFLKRQECVPYHMKVSISRDTALALSYLHRNGYVHGDLTSSNVLILGEFRAKVTDYWMMNVQKYGKMKDFTEIEEKRLYMAPERMTNPRNVSKKSDSYSFGIIVSEIDTSTIPSFRRYSQQKGYSQQSVVSLFHLPKESPFATIAQSCLAVEPDLRPSFDEICTDLESKMDLNYEISMHESRLLKLRLQAQFASQLDNLKVKMLAVEAKLKDKEAKLSQQIEMANYLLKTNKSLKLQLQSNKQEIADEGLVTEEHDLVQQEESGILESDQLDVSSTILGKGESSTIYYGKLRSKDIAFKKFIFHQTRPEKWFTNLHHETSLLTRISHRNVVKIFGIKISPGNTGIVMELMHRTLNDVLFPPQRNNSLPLSKKNRIVRQVGFGIEYLHSQNICHGKLSVFNILESEDGIYKVAGYGPKCAQNNFKSYHIMDATAKSYFYTAPEILRRDIMSVKHFQSADMYSLALISYEIMTESHCFLKTTAKKQLTSMVLQYNARPSLEEREGITPTIKDLLVKCWDADPNLRLSAQQFISIWKEIHK